MKKSRVEPTLYHQKIAELSPLKDLIYKPQLEDKDCKGLYNILAKKI